MIIARFSSAGAASSIVLYDALAVERDPGGCREEFTAGRLRPRSDEPGEPPRFAADYTTVRAWLILEGVPEEWADRALRSLRAGSLPFTPTQTAPVSADRRFSVKEDP
ncbi:hypothetical protein [Streptomonospora salina]|uniref:Uncharacterized protein n=1 Tax=Streptomonospora salina TaxID=104205 RepID=A0A841EDB3_9ACTN|nr:hypothetical protein [Streptomonospora salina]MBB6000384.1 hypothetical protein [Streptomonospora salina]